MQQEGEIYEALRERWPEPDRSTALWVVAMLSDGAMRIAGDIFKKEKGARPMVDAATENSVRTATEALRQEAGPNLRVTEVSTGMTATNFGDSITDPGMKKKIGDDLGAIAMPADAIARGILFAVEQPPDIDVGSILIRPTAQG